MDKTLKVGIALGGGGAKGFAHIGVLDALGRAGIEFDMVAGTSIGALVGAVYASGNLPELERISRKYGVKDLPFLLGPTWPRKGLFSGNYIERLLGDIVRVQNIEDLGKPFAALAVDLNKAEVVTFTSGNLYRAVHASMSIPGLFKPVIDGDRILVDGGVLEPVPLSALRRLGADVVVAVDLLSNLTPVGTAPEKTPVFAEYIRFLAERFYMEGLIEAKEREREIAVSLVDIIQRSSIIAQRRLTEYNFRDNPPDVVIDPPLSDIKVLDFHRGESIVDTGRRAAEKAIPELRNILKRAAAR
ncbi:MAG TPA: patatin-like phospholipase family protein [Thermodesulfobacteriota bacterium]|nr:patatin-like phospholipase family protein [Thermodesulfobacteriota bacterium]